MQNLTNKFKHLYDVVSSDRFLSKEALGGEIPFFIAAYEAKQQLKVEDATKRLIKKLETSGVPVLELNLYDIACSILEEEIGLEEFFSIEKEMDKEEFLDAIQSVLEIHQVLMPKIDTLIKASSAKVYFLTGIGLVFPFIRSHTILNNLQSIAKDSPTVAFFPGEYNGHSLNLFGLLKDDNYYRAFNIDNIEAKQ
ncbi:DUF1788 domain-containing protein [Haloflavibacter putidus]|uniref:DUF1788 domain-containing protein n=1 Tax=Haloflavibacter putidus TaxID=2576776 RepID=A0A507ZW40_9FLAO|nr:DUF1788 domain-containing protein [Haloflavibacter putidus]TQD38995.1 DUF1788 domain-containing protein [Haloflavibacter putidus]